MKFDFSLTLKASVRDRIDRIIYKIATNFN